MTNDSLSSSSWSTPWWLHVLFMGVIATAALPFLFSNGAIDGDGAQSYLLYQGVFHDGYSLWNTAPAPGRAFQFVMLIDFACFALFGHPLLGYVVAACLKLWLLYASFLFLFRALFAKQHKAFASMASLVIVLGISLSVHCVATTELDARRAYVYFACYMAMANMCFAWLVQYLASPDGKRLALLCVMAVLGMLNSTWFTAFLLLPLLAIWVSAVVWSWWRWPAFAAFRQWLLGCLVLGATFVLMHFVVVPWLTPKHPDLQAYLPGKTGSPLLSLKGLVAIVVDAVQYPSLAVLLEWCVLLVAFGWGAVVLVRALRQSWSVDDVPSHESIVSLLVSGWLWISGLAIMLAILLLSPGYIYRYYTYLFYVSWCALGYLLARRWAAVLLEMASGGPLFRRVQVGLAALIGCVCIVGLPWWKQAPVSLSEALAYSRKAGDMQMLTKCMVSASKKYDLKEGLADYWTARAVSLMSSYKMRVMELKPRSLQFYHWSSNHLESFWAGGQHQKPPVYTFVILGGQQKEIDFLLSWWQMPEKERERIKLMLRRKGYKDHADDRTWVRRVRKHFRPVSNGELLPGHVVRAFGRPDSTFRCGLARGSRLIFVYKRSSGFDKRVKRHFLRQYKAWKKQGKYSYTVPPTVR